MKALLTAVGIATLGVSPAAAQAYEPYLVKDIDLGPRSDSSNPRGFHSLGRIVVFAADDDDGGLRLWRTDGTEAGTQPIDCPEGCSPAPMPFIGAGGRAFFWELQGSNWTLWITDGSPAGTLPLLSGVVPLSQGLWIPESGKLFFAARESTHGGELWVSDGTSVGTRMVADLHPGSQGSEPYALTSFQGTCAFVAADSPGAVSVWRSDGRPGAPQLIAGPWNSSRPGRPGLLIATGGRLYFQAATRRQGIELWVSDGTARGTAVIDVVPGRSWATIRPLGTTANLLYFALWRESREELWSSAGTGRSTRRLGAGTFRQIAGWSEPVVVGGRLLFMADDGVHGFEPWSLGSNPRDVRLLRDMCPGSCRGLGSFLGILGGRALFAADTSTFPRELELWLTDGTVTGTTHVRDVCSAETPSFECSFVIWRAAVLPRRLLLVAESSKGNDLWVVQASGAGVTARKIGPLDGSELAGVTTAAAAGRVAVFGARGGRYGTEPWRSDGTTAGTTLLRDVADADLGGSTPTHLQAVGSTLSFLADDGVHGRELWRSDGTEVGTRLVADLGVGLALSPTPFHGALLFLHDDELWRSDGTEAGTVPLAPAGFQAELASGGDLALFTGEDDAGDDEPWVTDGTVGGTRRLVDAEPGSASSWPRSMVGAAGRFFFTAETAGEGRELWVSDGTTAGSRLVVDLTPGEEDSEFGPLAPAGDDLFFIRRPQYGTSELWRTDGTEAGTQMWGSVEEQHFPMLHPIVAVGERVVVFTGLSGVRGGSGVGGGLQLLASHRPADTQAVLYQGRVYFGARTSPMWTLMSTDGTVAGTTAVLDSEGAPVPAPDAMAIFEDRLFWVAPVGNDPMLWTTDGTPGGTGPVELHDPDGTLRLGASMQAAGGRLYFLGWDRVHGSELWALPALED